MKKINLYDIIVIINKSLDLIDIRLKNHGNIVSYLMMKLLTDDSSYSQEDIYDICTLCVLHDIGAYKTAELDDLMNFETKSTQNHSLYGYLFLKYLSRFADKAEIVLYHHHNYNDSKNIKSKYKYESMQLHLCDRIAVLLQTKKHLDTKSLYDYADTVFNKNDIDKFISADNKYHLCDKILDGSYVEELRLFFSQKILNNYEVNNYLIMLPCAIDFRSEATVIHSIIVKSISQQLAEYMNLSKENIKKIVNGAYLHDIGKIATPVEILEKAGKLTAKEMDIMKKHATDTKNILEGVLDKETLDIAVHHHEKLDGSGYPCGLRDKDINMNTRVVIMADILGALIGERSYKKSLPKEKVIAIIKDMADNNKIDKSLVSLVIKYYDDIIKKSLEDCKDILNIYNKVNQEYIKIYGQFPKFYVSTAT